MPASCSADFSEGDVSAVGRQAEPLANSERIKQKFGNYAIQILQNDPGIRVSSLYSKHDGVKVIRTVAVVAYPQVIETAFSAEHDAIVAGQSIGTLFKNRGWEIEKRHQYFGEIESTGHLFGEPVSGGAGHQSRSAVHVYTLFVRKNGSGFEYASIAEIHHPEFLRIDDLAEMYGSAFDDHHGNKDKPGRFLDIVASRINDLNGAANPR